MAEKKIKEKKISVNQLDKYCDSYTSKNITTLTLSEDLEITVKRSIDFLAFQTLIGNVIANCVGEDGYDPTLKDFVFRKFVIEAFTNVTLPQNIEKQYSVLYTTHLFNKIEMVINPHQFHVIKQSIDEQIELVKMAMQNDVRAEIRSIAQDYTEILGKYKETLETITSTFDGVDMAQFIETASKMTTGYSEEKIVDATLNQIYDLKAEAVKDIRRQVEEVVKFGSTQ